VSDWELSGVEGTELSDGQIDLLRRYGTERDVAVGDVLFSPGDSAYDFVVVLAGRIDILGGPPGWSRRGGSWRCPATTCSTCCRPRASWPT
jgi:hypothetical protein